MVKKEQKIEGNQPQIKEAFLQVNIVKGYKFIDKAGELINSHIDEKQKTEYSININNLLIKNPYDNIEEIRYSPDFLWLKYNKTNFDNLLFNIKKVFDRLENIQDVKKYFRIGLRSVVLYNITKQQEKIIVSKQDFYKGEFSFLQSQVFYKTGKYNAKIIYSIIEEKATGKQFLQIDIDSFFAETGDISNVYEKTQNLIKNHKATIKAFYNNLVNNEKE